jgi:hypothetical protein
MKLNAIFSYIPQVGKTTAGINTMKDSVGTDNYYMSHDLYSVLDDALMKADKAGLRVNGLLDDKKLASKIRSARLSGEDTGAHTLFGLGNITQLAAVEDLAYASTGSGYIQSVHIDEIHKMALEPNPKREAQRDNWVKFAIERKYFDELNMYSASAHDIIMAPYITFDNVRILKPYDGYKSMEEAEWHIRSQDYFNAILEAYQNDEKPPNAFIDDMLEYPTMLLNISTVNAFHEWIEEHVPEFKQYNQKNKSEGNYLVGGLAMGMSQTFESHFLMLNRRSPSHRAAKWQAAGRPLGTKRPHYFVTQIDKDELLNYYENMKILCTEEIISLPGEKRAKFAESLTWINPSTVCSPKLRRQVTSNRQHLPGNEENCVEDYHSVFVGKDIANGEEWRGDSGAYADKVLEIFQSQNPDIELSGRRKSIQNRDELTKFRDTNTRDIRVGQDYSRPGRAYVIIRTGEYVGNYSFYNYDGKLLSRETRIEGSIYV